jgi:adenosylcobinamide-GDP ribazoletransferase
MLDDEKPTDAAPEDWSSVEWTEDLQTAASFLTRVPIGGKPEGAFDLRRASRAFPVAGALVGFVAGIIVILCASLGMSSLLSAALAILAVVIVTGAIHEDGLADTVDGFWGAADREGKLRIMRDARIGTFGVLALLFSVVVRIAGLEQILSEGAFEAAASLVAAAAVSRHGMVALMRRSTNARSEGLAYSAGTPWAGTERTSLIATLAIGLPAAWLASGIVGVLVAGALAILAFIGVRELARYHIGGHTGDVCGAMQQVIEIAVLTGLALTVGD